MATKATTWQHQEEHQVQNQNQNQNQKEEEISIDGSFGEGGGQVLRNSTSLAAILKKPIRIEKIRAGRDTPGLRPQHLTGIQLVNHLCHGNLSGAHVNSTSISFVPDAIQAIRSGYVADTKTAGSCTLLVQVALPCLLFASVPSRVTLKGGTDVAFSPPIDEIINVFMPIMKRHFGLDFDVRLVRRGFYPKGGGVVELHVPSPAKQIRSIRLINRGKIVSCSGRVFVSKGADRNLHHRLTNETKKQLTQYFSKHDMTNANVKIDIDEVEYETNCHGSGVSIWVETDEGCILGSSGLGERHKSVHELVGEAVEKLKQNILAGGCVDEWTQDQLILFMALANGKSVIRTGELTLHTQTSIHFCALLSGARFDVRKDESNKTFLIECEGIGFSPSHVSHLL